MDENKLVRSGDSLIFLSTQLQLVYSNEQHWEAGAVSLGKSQRAVRLLPSSKVGATSHSALHCPQAGHLSPLLFCGPGANCREKTPHPAEAKPRPRTKGAGTAGAVTVQQLQQRKEASSSRMRQTIAAGQGCGARLLHSAGDCSKRNHAGTQDGVELFWLNCTGELLGIQQCNPCI